MGIRVNELLTLEGFSGFKVVAGHGGLNKEVQGITILEAPDGFKWARGKELVLSSGYVIAMNPDCLEKAFEDGTMLGVAGFVLKRERYINKIPENIIALFDYHNIPLITMPFSISWMDLTREVNTAVMNRAMARLHVQDSMMSFASDQSYKEQKIRSILQAVENEMHFPAFLYDLSEGKSYFSSSNFPRISDYYNLIEGDYWKPTRPYTRHVLCDHTHMTRIRLVNSETDTNKSRISWILTPVTVNEAVLAYFVIMESREFIDYYDEYSIRISHIMLQNLYEQIYTARSASDLSFENLLQFALTCSEAEMARLDSQAAAQGMSLDKSYTSVIVTPKCWNELDADGKSPHYEEQAVNINLRNDRHILYRAFHQSRISAAAKIAVLDDHQFFIFFDASSDKYSVNDDVSSLLKDFTDNLSKNFEGIEFVCGYHTQERALRSIAYVIDKCRNSIRCGKVLSPEKSFWDYSELGPFAWFSVPEKAGVDQLSRYGLNLSDEKGRELVDTLRIYLSSNMNYSETANKMFLHINTVRKRIDAITEQLPVDLNDPMERLKLTILLQFVK